MAEIRKLLMMWAKDLFIHEWHFFATIGSSNEDEKFFLMLMRHMLAETNF